MADPKVRLLDGGMGRELERIGAPFHQPEWSALALIEGPEYVLKAHQAFIDAGADIITTNSYAVVPFHLGEERFAARGAGLAALAGRLARQVADGAKRPVAVAGSLPPALGSYRPDLFDPVRSLEIHRVLIGALAPWVDFWLAETQSSIAEIRAVGAALGRTAKPLWLSFTLEDERPDEIPRLRSGEPVAAAVGVAAADLGVQQILFNCSQPEVMGAALDTANDILAGLGSGIGLGVYANAFPPVPKDAKANVQLREIRADLGPTDYLAWARTWVRAGASVIGGCCGISPDHIAALKAALA